MSASDMNVTIEKESVPPKTTEAASASAPSELPPPYSSSGSPTIVEYVLGPKPVELMCHHCNETITTRVDKRVSMRTHTYAALCCFLGGLLLVWIPYCMDRFQSKGHYCPNCERFLGTGKEWLSR